MSLALQLAQLVLYIGLLALPGQGLLHLLAGQQRDRNLFYQLLAVVNRPWLALAQALLPGRLAERHRGWVALLLVGLLYAGVTLARISHCLAVGMAGCR